MKAAELLRFGFAIVVGWIDPEGARPWLGALLLAHYDPNGRLLYAGRVGAGIERAELAPSLASTTTAYYFPDVPLELTEFGGRLST